MPDKITSLHMTGDTISLLDRHHEMLANASADVISDCRDAGRQIQDNFATIAS